jgi:hypothetical protein
MKIIQYGAPHYGVFILNAYLSGKIFYSGVCGAVTIFGWV